MGNLSDKFWSHLKSIKEVISEFKKPSISKTG